jgi:hypothetical protein
MQDLRMAPARRRPGVPGRRKASYSPARTRIAIGSSRKGTYHSSMTTGPMNPAAATSYLTRPQGRSEAAWIAEALHGQVIMVPEAGHYPRSQRPHITAPAMIRFAETVNNRA